jgi:nicotinamide mononucleotide transporter
VRVIGRWEVAANAFNVASVLLAGRNSVHTWWTGIVASALFGVVFYSARLYADVALQSFFLAAAAAGWWAWLRGGAGGRELPVRRGTVRDAACLIGAGVVAAAACGWVLRRFSDAYAPFFDSLVLAFSVLGQVLLVRRRYEAWWCWLLVNTIAVPLYAARGLYLTAGLYLAFWVNAAFALAYWRRLLRPA